MEKIKLTNLNLYTNDNQLFIGFGDGYLSKVEGEDIKYVNIILEYLQLKDDYIEDEILYQYINDKESIDKGYFFQLLEWLKGNGILNYLEKDSEEKHDLNFSIIGLSSSESENITVKLNKKLSKDGRFNLVYKKLIEINLEDLDFCLIFSPMLNKSINQEIFNELYKKKIKHLYIDYSSLSATMGPAINPLLKMHCLSCFFKRRISNTSKPNTYLSLIKLDSKQIRYAKLEESNISETLVEWLGNELIRLLYSDWESSGVLGKTKNINFATDEFTTSKILKIVNCEICNERKIYRPLNG